MLVLPCVTAVGEQQGVRPSDLTGHRQGVIHGYGDVVTPVDDQRPGIDLSEPTAGIEAAGRTETSHQPLASICPHRCSLRWRRRGRSWNQECEGGPGTRLVAILEREEEIGDGASGALGTERGLRGRTEHQPGQELGVAEGEGLSHHPSEGRSQYVGARESERPDEGGEIVRQIIGRVCRRLEHGVAPIALIVGDHRER